VNPERILKRFVPFVTGIVLLIVVVAAIASGGGSSDTTSTVPTVTGALTKETYISQADGICESTNTAIAKLSTGAAASDPTLQAEQEYSLTKSELSSLEALGKPTEDQATLDQFLNGLQTQVNQLKRKKLAVERGDTTALTDVDTKLTSAKSESQAAARQYGFTSCGQSGKASTGGGTTTTAPLAPTTEVPATTTTTPVTPVTPAPSGGTGGGAGTGGGGSTGGGGGSGGSGGVSP
jgi:hypothetical protein